MPKKSLAGPALGKPARFLGSRELYGVRLEAEPNSRIRFAAGRVVADHFAVVLIGRVVHATIELERLVERVPSGAGRAEVEEPGGRRRKIGRASCRERVLCVV